MTNEMKITSSATVVENKGNLKDFKEKKGDFNNKKNFEQILHQLKLLMHKGKLIAESGNPEFTKADEIKNLENFMNSGENPETTVPESDEQSLAKFEQTFSSTFFDGKGLVTAKGMGDGLSLLASYFQAKSSDTSFSFEAYAKDFQELWRENPEVQEILMFGLYIADDFFKVQSTGAREWRNDFTRQYIANSNYKNIDIHQYATILTNDLSDHIKNYRFSFDVDKHQSCDEFFNKPIGYGYDDGINSAIQVCHLLNNQNKKMSEIINDLPKTFQSPTMAPYCKDDEKYSLIDELVNSIKKLKKDNVQIDGMNISKILTVNGIRFTLEDGSWGLVRASSNKPSLVVVVESPSSEKRKKNIFDFIDSLLKKTNKIGEYDQKI